MKQDEAPAKRAKSATRRARWMPIGACSYGLASGSVRIGGGRFGAPGLAPALRIASSVRAAVACIRLARPGVFRRRAFLQLLRLLLFFLLLDLFEFFGGGAD